MPNLSSILGAKSPLTLSSVVRGAQPLVMADLARASSTRAVFIAADDAAMNAMAETAHYFAPEIEVLEFPAWDCLPYDRASPALSVSAKRLSALHRLQAGKAGSQLLVTTVNALLQRVVTPFRVRELIRALKPGMEIGRESLIALLQRQGYSRTDTVADAGEYAVRGSLFDIFPVRPWPRLAARFLRRRAGKLAPVRSQHAAHDRHARRISTAACQRSPDR